MKGKYARMAQEHASHADRYWTMASDWDDDEGRHALRELSRFHLRMSLYMVEMQDLENKKKHAMRRSVA